ncbi:MAG TPA: serpin family protein [Pirellulales bacterium]|nr:serpin family protein [Pirellulales bacterium]
MPITDDVDAVVQGGNAFAADLYARLRLGQSSNLFFSPCSTSMALAMTYAGAEGQTADQMARVLHFPLPKARLNPAFNRLRAQLTGSGQTPDFQLRVANRLWGQQGFHFLPEFLRVTGTDFGAELGLLDFKQAETARTTINAWVDERTDHKIPDLLARGVVDTSTRLVLTNAIYFKARWTHEFSKSATTDAPFHISVSQQVAVPTMHQMHRLRYCVIDNVQLLELPYGEFGTLSMLVLLPKAIDGLGDLEKRLTRSNLQTWTAGLQPRLVNVRFPRFKMTSEFSLADVLESLGMPLAFSTKADFSGMSSEEQFFISAVIHKAFVDVNEEGTEAAAATAVGIRLMAAPPSPEKPVEFRADHPFAFIILDSQTQSILFLGRLANPKG